MKVLGFQIEINGALRFVSTSEELRRAISEIGKELKKATDVGTIQKLEKELIDLKARQNEVNKEVRESVKTRQQELTSVDRTSSAYDQLSKELNEARKRYKDLAATEQENTEEAKALIKQITLLDGKLKGIDATVGQFQRSVGNYPSALGGVVSSIDDIKNASSGAVKALGVVAVGFQLFNAASAAIDELNQSFEETRIIAGQIQTFTGATGKALQDQVAQAKAVSETYKADVRDVSVAANTLSKELGVDFARALELIEAGFRKGADAQGQFLDGIKEYSVQFRDAGASAEQFIAVSIAASNAGIYSDKGLDAVKEFGLRIREQAKATGDALRAALGSEFTDKLFKDLNSGAINSVDALGKVTRALKENGVQGAELQTVIADVFGGPGEDVGQKFLFTLGEILETTDGVTESTTSYQVQLGELFQANLDLENAQKGYNEALGDFSFELQVAKTRAKTFFAELLAGVFTFGDQLPATFKAAGNAFKAFFRTGQITEAFDAYNKTFKTEVRKIKDANEVQKAILEQLNPPKEPVKKPIRDFTKSIAEELVKGSVAEIEKRKGDLDKAFERAVAGSDAQRLIAANLEKVNKELEAAIEKQNKILLEAERNALAQQINGITELLTTALPTALESGGDTTKAVLSDIEKITKATSNSIKKTAEEANNSFENLTATGEQLFNAALDVIGAFQAARAEKEQEAFDLQLEQIDENIEALEEKQQNVGRIRAKQIQREIDSAKRQREAAEAQAEEAQKKAAKREKTLALLQAVVQGSLAVIRALAAPPGFPLNAGSVILTGVLAAAQVATIAAQPLATGGIITGRRVTDAPNVPTQPSGDNVLAVVKRGEVVLNESQQNALGGYHTFRSIGVPGFAEGGVIGAPAISAPIATMPGASVDYIGEIKELIVATNSRIDRIQAYVVSEDVRNDLAEGDRLKVEATL